jgi:protein required for attachment to host cells
MPQTLILVASSSQAKLYLTNRLKFIKSNGHAERELQLLQTFEHEASRKKGIDLDTDGPGRYRDQGTQGHGSFESETTPHQIEEERFAIELAHALNEERTKHPFTELVLVAAPRFQGYLQKHLAAQIKKMVLCTIDKDYTKTPFHEFASHLQAKI